MSQHGPATDGEGFDRLGLVPSGWDAAPGTRFGRHSHRSASGSTFGLPLGPITACRVHPSASSSSPRWTA